MSGTNCKAAFSDIYVDTNGDVLPCCYIQRNNQSKIGDIDDLNDWFFNDKEMQSLRNNLSTGIKDKRCDHCWKTEEKGQWTLRSAIPFDLKTPKAKLLHITGGKLCNMACRMCSPDLSSMIHDENRPWPRPDMSNGPHNWIDDPEKAKKLVDMINSQDLDGIQIQGGEPQLMKGFVNILEQISDDKKSKMSVQVTTNAGVFNERFWKQIVKFNSVVAGISIDATGERFSVIRYNGIWKNVEKNCDTILNYLWQNHKSNPPSVKLNLNIVLQLSNVDQCNEMVAFYEAIKNKLPGLGGVATLMPVVGNAPWDISNIPLEILELLPNIESNSQMALEWKQHIENAKKYNRYDVGHKEDVLSREKHFKNVYEKCLWDLKPEWRTIYEKE